MDIEKLNYVLFKGNSHPTSEELKGDLEVYRIVKESLSTEPIRFIRDPESSYITLERRPFLNQYTCISNSKSTVNGVTTPVPELEDLFSLGSFERSFLLDSPHKDTDVIVLSMIEEFGHGNSSLDYMTQYYGRPEPKRKKILGIF